MRAGLDSPPAVPSVYLHGSLQPVLHPLAVQPLWVQANAGKEKAPMIVS